jgi:hypothetical protein
MDTSIFSQEGIMAAFMSMGCKQALSGVEKGQILTYKKKVYHLEKLQEGLKGLLSL